MHIVESLDPEARRVSLGDQATEDTGAECFSRILTHSHLCVFQMHTAPPCAPQASHSPPGDHATARTHRSVNRCTHLPVSASQTRTVMSSELEASHASLGDQAIEVT